MVAEAYGNILTDGDMESLTVGTSPDVGIPAGAWSFPANYIAEGLAEQNPSQFSIVPTSSVDPNAAGNSLRLDATTAEHVNLHLPIMFPFEITESPGQIVQVTFDIWVESGTNGGGAVYLSGDHGGGGFSNLSDRGPQISWRDDGNLHYDGPSWHPITLGYPRGKWQSVRLDIDLVNDTFDMFWTFENLPIVIQVGYDLAFRSGPLDHLDRFTFVHFGDFEQTGRALIDNIVVEVVPEPSSGLTFMVVSAIAASRRRSVR